MGWVGKRRGQLGPVAGTVVVTLFLAACGAMSPAERQGDPARGAALFVQLPCAGCHGATAQGQFGPPLAGTGLSFDDLRHQVRTPRGQMVPFDEGTVGDDELRHIYAWLTSLPTPDPTAASPAIASAPAPAQATAQARDRLYPELDAPALRSLVDHLDELTLRVSGQVLEVEAGERFTQVWLQVGEGEGAIKVLGLYDTRLARQAFPALEGERVTVYGVGARPVTVSSEQGATRRWPRLQILQVRR